MIRKILITFWRSILVGIVYVLALMTVGIFSSLMGVQISADKTNAPALGCLLASGMLIALFLGWLASQIPASRWRHFLIWSSVIFFNMGSVVIEGALFAPELVPIPLPILLLQQLVASAVAALLITLLFASPGKAISLASILRQRPWFSWVGRFLVSSLAYLLFYYLFGAINYNLVTQPYYTTHAGGLIAPPASLVWVTEIIRAPLIILSGALFIFSSPANRGQLAWQTGLMLFWIGGVAPLLMQVEALPLLLLLASSVEIFLQNFLTGAVAALLLWAPKYVGQKE